MKTAVLISGQTRTFTHCLPTLQWHVFRHLSDPHFFISVEDDAQAAEVHLIEADYPADRVFIEKVKQPELCLPGSSKPATSDLMESRKHKATQHAPYLISSSIQAILKQLWHLNRVWEFFNEQDAAWFEQNKMVRVTGRFQTVIRCRPDLWFRQYERPTLPIWEAVTQISGSEPRAFVPWLSGCGGINDRFAYLTPNAAEHYFTAYTKLKAMLDAGCPLHPESLMLKSLQMGGVDVRKTLQAIFSVLRPNGQTVGPVEYAGELAAFLAERQL